MFKLNRAMLELNDDDLKEALGDITPEGMKLAMILNNRQKDVFNDITKTLDYLDDMYSQVKTTQDTMNTQMQGMANEIRVLRQENSRLKTKSEDLENYSRRNNLIIKGIAEGQNQNIEELVRSFLFDFFGGYGINIERMHRLGRFQRHSDGRIRARPIIVRFSFFADRQKVWNSRFNLEYTKYSLDEDFCPEVQAVRRKLLPVLLEAKRRHKTVEMVKDTLWINGKSYTIDSLHSLPKEMRDGSRWSDDQVSFFGELCPASNFHPATFTHEGKTVENSEKMLFYKMAKLFKDDFMASKIEKESDPRVIKTLSKSIEGVNRDEWNSSIKRLVTPILIDKFSQNSKLLEWLKSTGNRRLVEAAGPHDKVWGNGLYLSADTGLNPANWPGQNLQGQMLMDVRDALCSDPVPERVRHLLTKVGPSRIDDDDDAVIPSSQPIAASQGFQIDEAVIPSSQPTAASQGFQNASVHAAAAPQGFSSTQGFDAHFDPNNENLRIA